MRGGIGPRLDVSGDHEAKQRERLSVPSAPPPPSNEKLCAARDVAPRHAPSQQSGADEQWHARLRGALQFARADTGLGTVVQRRPVLEGDIGEIGGEVSIRETCGQTGKQERDGILDQGSAARYASVPGGTIVTR